MESETLMLAKVEFASFALDSGRNRPLIVLRERSGKRRFAVGVGPLEAAAIAVEAFKVDVRKPLTIDVAKSLLMQTGATLSRVVFVREKDGCVSSRLELSTAGGVRFVSCRPCDAIALALRCKAPLYAHDDVFERAPDSTSAETQPSLAAYIASLDTLDFGTFPLE